MAPEALVDGTLNLGHPPIIEAVLDFDCDLPPGMDLKAMESRARAKFAPRYPRFRFQMLHEHQFEQQRDQATFSARHDVQALQFLTDDEKQVVQARKQGFSFNRLAPYASLDDYLPEIRSSWDIYREIFSPLQVRIVRLRYLNRIVLPLKDGSVKFADYLAVGPQVCKPVGLSFRGFFNQNVAVEESTGNEINVVMATQTVDEQGQPIILDITVSKSGDLEADDWGNIEARVQSLRRLKNRVFESTLTEQCLSLFQ